MNLYNKHNRYKIITTGFILVTALFLTGCNDNITTKEIKSVNTASGVGEIGYEEVGLLHNLGLEYIKSEYNTNPPVFDAQIEYITSSSIEFTNNLPNSQYHFHGNPNFLRSIAQDIYFPHEEDRDDGLSYLTSLIDTLQISEDHKIFLYDLASEIENNVELGIIFEVNIDSLIEGILELNSEEDFNLLASCSVAKNSAEYWTTETKMDWFETIYNVYLTELGINVNQVPQEDHDNAVLEFLDCASLENLVGCDVGGGVVGGLTGGIPGILPAATVSSTALIIGCAASALVHWILS